MGKPNKPDPTAAPEFNFRDFARKLAECHAEFAYFLATHGMLDTPYYHGWIRKSAEEIRDARRLVQEVRKRGTVPVADSESGVEVLVDLMRFRERLTDHVNRTAGDSLIHKKDRNGHPFVTVVSNRMNDRMTEGYPVRWVEIEWLEDLLKALKPNA